MKSKVWCFAVGVALCGNAASGPDQVTLELKGKWPRFQRGTSMGVAVAGNYACVAAGDAGLQVITIGNPADPQQVGAWDTPGFVRGIAVSGNYAYVAEVGWGDGTAWHLGGLRVINISDPTNPQMVGSSTIHGSAMAVAGSDGYAYVADWDLDVARLEVIDVSNAIDPRRLGGCDTRSHGFTTAITVIGRYAYLTTSGGLEVIDISVPGSPRRVGVYDCDSLEDVAVSGDYAYVAGHRGLQVIDVSNPANPQRLAGFEMGENATGVAVSGDYAYVCSQRLWVVDISSPTNPRLVNAMASNITAGCLAISGGYACVLGSGWFQVIDTSSPTNPHLVGGYNTSGEAVGVALAGNYAYLADSLAGLQVIDISDSANPRRVGGFDTGESVNGVALSGNYAHVVDGDLEVLDLTDPVHPKRVGGYEFNFGGAALHVAVSGNHALVTEGVWWDGTNVQSGGLDILDISDPASPQRLGREPCVGTPSGVAVSGNYAYMFSRRDWGGKQCLLCPGDLEVIDFSDPASPQEVGRCETMLAPFGVTVSGNYVYVAGGGHDGTQWTNGLQAIDVSNPTNPRKLGFCGTDGFVGAVSGNYAYLCGQEGLQVIDISNPTNPQRVGGAVGYATAAVAVHQGKICVAGGTHGLLIYQTLPFIKSVSRAGQYLNIAWEGFGPAKLQRAISLTNSDWQDLLGSENTNAVWLPVWGGPEFFRLVKP